MHVAILHLTKQKMRLHNVRINFHQNRFKKTDFFSVRLEELTFLKKDNKKEVNGYNAAIIFLGILRRLLSSFPMIRIYS